MIFGVLSLIIAVGELAFGIGAWTLKPWAWMVGVAVEVGSVLLSIILVVLGYSSIASVIVSIIIAAIILYYLFTPPIRRAFGQA